MPASKREAIEPSFSGSPLLERQHFSHDRPSAAPAPLPENKKKSRWRWLWLFLLMLILLAAVIYQESKTHFYQSELWHYYSQKLQYHQAPGTSDTIVFPTGGPLNQRMGYQQLPQWSPILQDSGFSISQQARFSPELALYARYGFNPPYPLKTQAGLQITDCQQQPMYQFNAPEYQFQQLADVAPLLRHSLLFIENRKLLSDNSGRANPALDWPRLAAAAQSQIKKLLDIPAPAAGGSTLATQMEKYQHSAHGYTSDFADKFRQLVSASVKAYHHSVYTRQSSRQILLNYINSVPLAATAQHGEIHGMADGLHAWFGADPFKVNRLLQDNTNLNAEHGLALRQVLALIIAQRRPSYYLLQGQEDLEELINSHLRLLQQHNIISVRWMQLASNQRLHFASTQAVANSSKADKTTAVVRTHLAQLLGQNLYQTDRLDLSVQSSLNLSLQQQIQRHLQQLAEPESAEASGLVGPYLLRQGQGEHIRYSFTLYQHTPKGNMLRVQTDTSEQLFDINESSKLELGSTAKLRVLATYLQIIAELYQLYAEEPAEHLEYVEIAPQDHLTQWVISYLQQQQEHSLQQILDDAMNRTYSANPKESFFTGGGLHTFNNFRREEDQLLPTLHQAFQQSVNLPFVRLMQDIVSYSIHHAQSSSYQLLKNDNDPRRTPHLRRFADKEGTTFLRRFWQKYQGKTSDERLQIYLTSSRPAPERLSAAYRYIFPEHSPEHFANFMQQQFSEQPHSLNHWKTLHQKYQPTAFNLPDRAFVARSHPLELWLLAFIQQQPDATFSDAVAASTQIRQDVYQWLFRTQSRTARDNRIRTMLEIEAFWDIHHRWQQLGYPFDYLVPSLATALGSSGDRPAALAELIGIIINGGKRVSSSRLLTLDFAANTPYATRFDYQANAGQQVMPEEVAATLYRALQDVVSEGTGRRAHYTFGARQLELGGKTGTGDNRISTVNSSGRVIHSRALNRTATFAFFIAPDHFGVLTAFVTGQEAADHRFTSALPLQVMASMAPVLLPYLHTSACQ